MRFSSALSAIALSVGATISAAGASPQEFQVRLLTPLASYSKVGTRFEAKLIGATSTFNQRALPPDTRIFGSVSRAHATGLGFRRERAVLELEFDACALPTGESVACDVTLTAVDNARERVRNGRIRGILAAQHPNSWLSGLWYRPDLERIPHSLLGLTGAGGMIYTRLMPSPAGAALMIGSHLLLFRIPDPEIELPSGTDLIVQIDAGVSANQLVPQPAARSGFSEELLDRLAGVPAQLTKAREEMALDLVNIALMGDRDQVTKAFQAAGWSGTETRNARTLARTYSAYAGMKTYATAPVSRMYNSGRLPDLVFQKSFNTLARRHHVRLWEVDVPGGTAWIGAATHDTEIAFNAWRMSLAHRIDPLIDREKNVLINDLGEAGCLAAIETVERPELSQSSRANDTVTTDGTLTVAALRDCTNPNEARVAPMRPHRSFGALVLRQVVLDTRNYAMRGNAYYWIYSGLRRIHASHQARRGALDNSQDGSPDNQQNDPSDDDSPIAKRGSTGAPENASAITPAEFGCGFVGEPSIER